MDKNNSKKGMWILVFASFLVLFFFIFMRFQKQDTMTIGIFSGSNWDVPGTEHYELFQKAIEKFHEDHPNIKIEYQEGIPAQYYSEWLASNILKGCEPDIFLVYQEDLPTFLNIGVLKNLNEEILADDSFQPNLFYQSAYLAGNDKTLQYALPFECNPKMMFVNKTLLKEEGIEMPENDWTWDDFYNICKAVTKDKDGDGKTDQFGVYGYNWLDAVYSNGITPFTEGGKDTNIAEKPVVDAIDFLKKLNAINENYTVTSMNFDLGKVAFCPLYFSEYRTYMPYPWRIKKYSQFEWNCVTMPAGPNGGNVSSMNNLMIGMSARTNKKKICWEFLKMLTTDPEIQEFIYMNTAGASALKLATRSEDVMRILNQDTPGDSDIDMSLLDLVIENAVIPKHFGQYNAALRYADNSIHQILGGSDELNLALFELKNDLRKILNAY